MQDKVVIDFIRPTCVTMTDSDKAYLRTLTGKKSVNANFRALVKRYKKIMEESTYELANLFTSEEWLFMAATMRNQQPEEMYICDKGAFISHIMNTMKRGIHKNYAIKMENLIDKINSLHAANITALYARLIDYDRHKKDIDKEVWSRF